MPDKSISTFDKVFYPSIRQSWGLLGVTILILLIASPVSILLKSIAGDEFAFLFYYIIAMGAACWYGHARRKKVTALTTYNFQSPSATIIILVIISTIAIQAGLIIPLSSSIPMPDFMKQVFIELAQKNGFFSFLAIVIAAPLLEELMFRGIILDGLLQKYSPLKSILMSSLFFGLVHLNPWQFVTAVILGCFSGWTYYKTRSLFLPVVIHSFNNFVAFGFMRFWDAEEFVEASLTEIYGGTYLLVVITGGALVVGAACLYYLKSEFADKKEVYEEGNRT